MQNALKKTISVAFAHKTHRDGQHDETKAASVSQYSLKTTWDRMNGCCGIDEDLEKHQDYLV